MNFLCPTVSRTPCLNPRSLFRSCPKFDSLAARLAQTSQRSYSSIHTRPLRRREECYKPIVGICRVSSALSGRLHIRAFASGRIITRWEDLPTNYKEDQGLLFGTKPLSKEEIARIFGKGMTVQRGNRLLQVLHGRRVAGILKEPDYFLRPGFNEHAHNAALSWLRQNIPVDEDYSEGMRAEQELLAMGLDVDGTGDSYEPNAKPVEEGSVYGVGTFEKVRRAKEKAWEEEQAARKKREEEAGYVSGGLQTAGDSGVVLRTPGQNPKLQYYLERAKVLPDILPEMSIFQRLWPSAVFSLLFVGGVVMLAYIYIPPTQYARLMPSIPPAAATIGTIIACNTVVFVLWHVPPAFRMLEKYFIAVPGYPRALSMLGNTFSHKNFSHLAVNMLGLWFAGTRLHDEVGRGNFLAIYLCSGVLGSFFSLSSFVVRSHFTSSSLGASGAVMGVAAAYLWLYHDENMKFFGLPPDPWQGVPASVLLALLVLGELVSVWRGRKADALVHDHAAHLGGAITGLVGGHIMRMKAQEKARLEKLRRKNLSVIERIKEGRL